MCLGMELVWIVEVSVTGNLYTYGNNNNNMMEKIITVVCVAVNIICVSLDIGGYW